MVIPHANEKLSTPQDAANCIHSILTMEDAIDRDKEHFWVISLAVTNTVKNIDLVTIGGMSKAVIFPREVFRRAVIAGAGGIIVAHNHPGGSSDPSSEDRALTKQLIKAGQLLGIPVLDHVIVTGTEKEYFSFSEDGTAFPR